MRTWKELSWKFIKVEDRRGRLYESTALFLGAVNYNSINPAMLEQGYYRITGSLYSTYQDIAFIL